MTKTMRGSLRRARQGAMVAGVAQGFANFFGINVFWFRLILLLALIPGGVPGIGIYAILWLVIPKETG